MPGIPSKKKRKITSIRLDEDTEKALSALKKKLEDKTGLEINDSVLIRKLIRTGLLHTS